METLNAIFDRSSYRGPFTDYKVPREDLRKIMEAGLAAPSGCNRQSVSLVAIDETEQADALKGIVKNSSCATANAFILVFTTPIASVNGDCYNLEDLGAAVENMLLTIKELGYETCWYQGGVKKFDKELTDLVEMPEICEFKVLLPIGIAAQTPTKNTSKKPFEERAWFNRHSQKEK